MIKHPRPKPILRKRRIKRHPVTGNKINKTVIGTDPSIVEPAKKKSSLRFAGPIKIIIVDPKSEYCKTVWCAVGIALTNVAIGGVLLAAIFYTIAKGDAHVAVCAVASNFFIAEALLALHYANGWTAPMRTRHRKFAHFFLNICGLICIIAGSIVVLIARGVSAKVHGITGIASLVLVILAALMGPFAYRLRKKWQVTLHMSIGIPAFICSSICTAIGFTLKPFSSWSGNGVLYILLGLVIFYTVFIVTSSFIKCMTRIN